MNRGGVGARSLDIELQADLNPVASAKSSVSAGPSRRDKVGRIENDYDKEVYDADIG